TVAHGQALGYGAVDADRDPGREKHPQGQNEPGDQRLASDIPGDDDRHDRLTSLRILHGLQHLATPLAFLLDAAQAPVLKFPRFYFHTWRRLVGIYGLCHDWGTGRDHEGSSPGCEGRCV